MRSQTDVCCIAICSQQLRRVLLNTGSNRGLHGTNASKRALWREQHTVHVMEAVQRHMMAGGAAPTFYQGPHQPRRA